MSWQYGFEHGPGNATTGAAYRAATMPRGAALAQRAVALAPRSSAAATAHSTALLLDFDWAAAAKEAQRAIALNASDTDALAWLTKIQTMQLDMGAALRTAEQAQALDPLNGGLAVSAGSVLYMMEEYAALRDKLLPVVKREPTNVGAWDWLAMAYKGLKNYSAALDAYHTAITLAPDDVGYPITELLASVAHTYGVAGRSADAERLLDQLLATARTAYVEPVRLAFVYTSIGQHAQALEQLSQAVALKQWELAFVRSEPWFKPLHGSAGFDAIVRRCAFPAQKSDDGPVLSFGLPHVVDKLKQAMPDDFLSFAPPAGKPVAILGRELNTMSTVK